MWLTITQQFWKQWYSRLGVTSTEQMCVFITINIFKYEEHNWTMNAPSPGRCRLSAVHRFLGEIFLFVLLFSSCQISWKQNGILKNVITAGKKKLDLRKSGELLMMATSNDWSGGSEKKKKEIRDESPLGFSEHYILLMNWNFTL